MTDQDNPDVTQLLRKWREGSQTALAQLMPVIYGELRRLAGYYMSQERKGQTLQATALVHEAYLRLVGKEDLRFQNRAHFFALASQIMRRILVDHARGQNYAKRGGGAKKISLDELTTLSEELEPELVSLDEALNDLAEIDPRKSRVVELRVFGGLTVPETANVLEVSSATVINEYRFAKAWLYNQMKRAHPSRDCR